ALVHQRVDGVPESACGIAQNQAASKRQHHYALHFPIHKLQRHVASAWLLVSNQMQQQSILSAIIGVGVVPIIRAESTEAAIHACEAIYRGGIRAIEITMTVPGAI